MRFKGMLFAQEGKKTSREMLAAGSVALWNLGNRLVVPSFSAHAELVSASSALSDFVLVLNNSRVHQSYRGFPPKARLT